MSRCLPGKEKQKVVSDGGEKLGVLGNKEVLEVVVVTCVSREAWQDRPADFDAQRHAEAFWTVGNEEFLTCG